MVWHQNTLHTARLLDPCFKTGWREENFKRAGFFDWWTRLLQRIITGQCNCPATSATAARPEHRLKPYSSTHASSSVTPRAQATVCDPPVKLVLLPRTSPFFAPPQWTTAELLLLPFGSLYAISGSFNLPFGILFNFPSQYFSAIGLHVIFRFRRNLPPALRWNHNQRDSKGSRDLGANVSTDKGVSPSMLQLSNWLSVPSAPPCHFLERSIGLTSVVSPNPFPLICTFFVRHY